MQLAKCIIQELRGIKADTGRCDPSVRLNTGAVRASIPEMRNKNVFTQHANVPAYSCLWKTYCTVQTMIYHNDLLTVDRFCSLQPGLLLVQQLHEVGDSAYRLYSFTLLIFIRKQLHKSLANMYTWNIHSVIWLCEWQSGLWSKLKYVLTTIGWKTTLMPTF